jgi:hypothetical protein
MSAFEDFIQAELPRRPWVAADPSQETIPVRRGAGPRQLDFVALTDGQVLGKVSGVVQGITVPGLGGETIPKGYVHIQVGANVTWSINHAMNSLDCVPVVFNASGQQLIPDSFAVVDADNVTITFQTAMTGKAIILFAS